jgi:hypothetical protein
MDDPQPSLPFRPTYFPALDMRVSSVALALFVGSGLLTATAHGQPAVSRLEPIGVAPGFSGHVVVHGGGLNGATELWTSFSDKAALATDVENNGQDAARVVFQFNAPADAAPGIHGVRVTTPGGVSGVAAIMVDDLPTVLDAGGNGQPESAQLVTVPGAIDGYIDNLARDFYRFSIDTPQTLTMEVFARRLGSPLDPIMFLYDSQGRELAYCDDARGLSTDAQISHEFVEPGEYIIEVRDIRYSGGGNHFYRLRIGDFPAVNTAYPMAVATGGESRVDFAGVSIDMADPAFLNVPADASGWLFASTHSFQGTTAGFAPVEISNSSEAVELEPNDTPRQANPTALGSGVNGRFASPGDVDCYRLTATAGQRFLFEGIARRRGSPVDLKLQLLDPAGNVVGTAEDNGIEEGRLDYTFPADGNYVLKVSDLHRHGGSAYAYRVAVTPWQPRFNLTTDTDTINIPAGGVARVTVTAERLDYGGPIEVTCIGLPEGVTCSPTWIGPNRALAALTLTAAESATGGVMAPIKIVGRADINGQIVERAASAASVIRTRWSNVTILPPQLEQQAAVAVAPAQPLRLAFEPAEVVFGRELSTTVKVTAVRGEGQDQAIVLAFVPEADPLPAGVSFEIKNIEPGTNEVTLALSATADVAIGPYTVAIQGTHSKDNVNTIVSTPGVTLRIAEPMTLSTPLTATTLARGAQLSVPVIIARNPAFAGEIRLTLDKLPAGVTAAEVVIPAGATTGEVVLQAAADAAQGAATEITINATGVENGNLNAALVLPAITVQ